MMAEVSEAAATPSTPVFDGTSIYELRASIFNRGRDWKTPPPHIRGNEYTVVQSDTKYHFFNGVDTSLCNIFRCGCVENVRARVTFHKRVPADVRVSDFCAICRTKARTLRQADAKLRTPQEKNNNIPLTVHGETVEENVGDIHCFTAEHVT